MATNKPPKGNNADPIEFQIFLGWSGDRSKQLALALHSWLRKLFENVKPWMSDTDIPAGSMWESELLGQLSESDFAVICLTRENLVEPWLHFEAGFLTHAFDMTRVVPYRLHLEDAELPPQFAAFQSVVSDKEGTLKLVKALNSHRNPPMKDARLMEMFDSFWPHFEKKIRAIPETDIPKPVPDRNVIDEIHQIVRESRAHILTMFRDEEAGRFETIANLAQEMADENKSENDDEN